MTDVGPERLARTSTSTSSPPTRRGSSTRRATPTRLPGLWVRSLDTKKAFPLGDGLTADSRPGLLGRREVPLLPLRTATTPLVFQRLRVHLRLPAARRASSSAALAPDTPALFPPKSDEEKGKAEEPKNEEKKDETKPQAAPTGIAADGLVSPDEEGAPRPSRRRRSSPPDRRPPGVKADGSAPSRLRPTPSATSAARTATRTLYPLRPEGAEGGEGPRRRRGLRACRSTARSSSTAPATTGS